MRVPLHDGTRIFVEVIGRKLVPDGPTMRERQTMLLLHGGPGFDHSTLANIFEPLAEELQLVLIDHRGQGRSDRRNPEEWNLTQWVADLVELCELLELEEPIVLGQSFGGVVALAAASRHPELASKLVVSSSLAKLRLDRALPMFERLGGPEVRAVAERHFDELSDESAQEFLRVCLPVYNQKPMDPDVLARVRLNLDVGNHFFRNEFLEIDLLPELGAIACPTLVLAGELDPITPVADAEDIAAAIPHAELRVFDGAGHGVFRDKPDEALEVIRDFVSR